MPIYEMKFVADEWDVACTLELAEEDGRFEYDEHWTCSLAETGGHVSGSWSQEGNAVVLRPDWSRGATFLPLPTGEECRAELAGDELDCAGYRLELREEKPAEPMPSPSRDRIQPSAPATAAEPTASTVSTASTAANAATYYAASAASINSTASAAAVPPAPQELEASPETLRQAGLRVPPPELAARIRELIAELPAGGASQMIMGLCRSNGMLPLMTNSIYLWGLRPDGVVLCVDHESFAQRVVVETDPFTVYAAMMQGVRRFPELQPLVPERPAGLVRCDACEGRGYIRQPGQRIPDGCLRCAGVGWNFSRAAADADQSAAGSSPTPAARAGTDGTPHPGPAPSADPRQPMNRLYVRTSRMHRVAEVVLGIFFVGLAAVNLAMGVSGGINAVQLGMGALMLAAYSGVLALIRRGRSRSVKYFSEEGLERNDGRFFPWTELDRVVHQVRTALHQERLWRTEIRFRGGDAAWVLPMRVENYDEVSSFVRRLPCEHAEQQV